MYHASVRHLKGLALCLAILAGLVIIVPIVGRAYYFAAISLAIMILVVWRFKRMYFCLTEDALIYRGWWSTHKIPYSSIRRVFRPGDAGWPHDRFFAPSVFEIVSESDNARINLLWFGSSGSKAFQDRILNQGTGKHRIHS